MTFFHTANSLLASGKTKEWENTYLLVVPKALPPELPPNILVPVVFDVPKAGFGGPPPKMLLVLLGWLVLLIISVSISVSTHSYCATASITYPKEPNPVDDPAVAVLLEPNSPPPLVVVAVPNAFRLAPKGDEFVVVAPKPSRML